MENTVTSAHPTAFKPSLTRNIAMFYLKCKIVPTCDSFHYLTTIYLETFQRISVTKVTCMDNFTF